MRFGSPAIDAADNTAVPADEADLDNDGNTDERIPIDLDGNPRFVDDPATADCSQAPGTCGTPPIVDMGGYEWFLDCNNNGLPDECDIDCSALGGTCNLPGCGQSADCQPEGEPGHGIPDECDIADCVGSPDCDDCNLNEIPDGCDIDSGTSQDVDPTDGVPDECADYTDGCAPIDDWTCADNWNLGVGYPDNEDSVSDLHVTLDSVFEVFLDETVVIDSLRLLDDATLRVTQELVGDLTTVDAGGILNEGTILVANDRAITVSGSAIIGAGGTYGADPGAVDVSASLTADSIALLAGPPFEHGGMFLEDSMIVECHGDFLMDGSTASADKGSDTPPILNALDDAGIVIDGNFGLAGAVQVEYGSTVSMSLGGDFDNESPFADLFVWVEGGLILRGSGGRGVPVSQTFEVAGEDRGPCLEGFDTNFAMDSVEVAAGADVIFSDDLANTTGDCEALYTHDLVVGSGANVTIDNCKVYYETLIDEDVTPTLIGCGQLRQLGCLMCDLNDDGLVSIIGDVPPFVDCLFLGNCDCPQVGCHCPGDCNGDGFLSVIGDVPCFVDCAFFGNCEECP